MSALRIMRRRNQALGNISRQVIDVHLFAPRKMHKEASNQLGNCTITPIRKAVYGTKRPSETFLHYVAWVTL